MENSKTMLLEKNSNIQPVALALAPAHVESAEKSAKHAYAVLMSRLLSACVMMS